MGPAGYKRKRKAAFVTYSNDLASKTRPLKFSKSNALRQIIHFRFYGVLLSNLYASDGKLNVVNRVNARSGSKEDDVVQACDFHLQLFSEPYLAQIIMLPTNNH